MRQLRASIKSTGGLRAAATEPRPAYPLASSLSPSRRARSYKSPITLTSIPHLPNAEKQHWVRPPNYFAVVIGCFSFIACGP
ncbi:hypothetical protein BU25DRAFT_415419 [Macroventuria anomochaeta]|uniref:Uncharacterized protein n=1 Tax=Macroventuria anomochaeta TaxID=301207 RepID=A0ACB6RMX3_9PLEO|nr:uncharacterized protein BU25DRAFT_415419 [Macroventuria anomochaeta]KAF2622269.1 hypothetical protein BU25DRAFT_415419 [Macroventuria anomochaeta]